MKLLIKAFVGAALFSQPFSSVALAAKDSKSQKLPFKVGAIDMQFAIMQTKEGKSIRKKLEAQRDERVKALKTKQQNLAKMQQELQSQASLLSDQAKAEKAQIFQREAQKFQMETVQMRQQLAALEQKEAKGIFVKFQQIIKDYSKKNKYDLIIDRGQGSILYVSEFTELTDILVKEYDKNAGKLKSTSKKK